MKISFNTTFRALLVLLGVLFMAGCHQSNGPVAPGIPVKLTVQVVDAISQQPLAGARVSLKQDSQNVATDVASDASGTAVFEGVPTGDGYKAFAGNVPGYAPGASPSIKLEQDFSVVIALSPSVNQGASLVSGSVKDASSQAPLPGVTVTLNPMIAGQAAPLQGYAYGAPYRLQQVGGLSAQTDQAGQFTIPSVNPGTYQAVYQLAGYQEAQRTVTVNGGDVAAIETVFLSNGQGGGGNNAATKGHVLIVESGRAVQLNPQGQIVWNFPGTGISCATRLPDGSTLVSDEQNNKVSIIGAGGDTIWELGSSFGLFSKLKAPGWVAAARDGQSFLIADTGNNRILEITGGQTSWQFEGLNQPRSATYVPNGNILIADTGNRRVIEVDRQGQVVWTYDHDMLAPVHAVRRDDGSTLITDAGYSRVIMIDANGNPFWYFDGGVSDGAPQQSGLNRPRSTMPTSYGTFLISDTGNNRVLEVDMSRQVVNSIPNLARPQVIERL